MLWRLILEEFGPELKYIKGENNIVAEALSRLNDARPLRELKKLKRIKYLSKALLELRAWGGGVSIVPQVSIYPISEY